MNQRPEVEHTYTNVFFDSGRWSEFTPRDGDVIVCTSYKAGTTWTQMICALLIHQTPELPAPLGELSPWLDMQASAIEVIIDGFERQAHRRIIKTHTALDGLPYFDNVTYVVCGRDPRDVFMSLQNHLANGDMEQIAKVIAAQGIEFEPPPPLPDDIDERFKLWLSMGSFAWEQDGVPYWSHFHHAETFWAHRALPNIQFLHYALRIEVAEAKWPALVKAASFADMKANADRVTPEAQHGFWLSNSQFFNKGENEQWRGALSDESLRFYDDVTRTRYQPDLIAWLERGSGATGDPKAR